jgi:hypothetical protein
MVVLLDYIRHQQANGYSPIIEFCGRQRMGKTRTAIRFALELDGDKLDLKEQLHVNALGVIKAYDKFNGRCIIYDEAGKDLDPYRQMSEISRAVSHVVQSQAYKRNVLFICLPFASDIGKTHRKQIDAVVHIYARGCYKLYACFRWHADLNDSPIRMTLMEQVFGVPKIPQYLEDYYSAYVEKQTKQDILNEEITKLENHNKPKQKVFIPSLFSQLMTKTANSQAQVS